MMVNKTVGVDRAKRTRTAMIHADAANGSWVGALLKIVAMLLISAILMGANFRTSVAKADAARSLVDNSMAIVPQAAPDGSIIRIGLIQK